MLAHDPLGSQREVVGETTDAAYVAAFEAIERDERNELIVVERAGCVVATLQITYIPSLTRHGAERAQIEGVRVSARERGHGIGKMLISWAIERARARDCQIVQLTTDKRRSEAHRFYASLGFEATHEGMKLQL
jgi:GNAT superfamily N-acetyltransferase